MKRSVSNPTRTRAAARSTAAIAMLTLLAGAPALAGGGKTGPKSDGQHDQHDQHHDGDHESGGVCQSVAQDTLRSCRNGARDEYWLAAARCDNAGSGNEAERGRHSAPESDACTSAARDDLTSALHDCADQLQARNDVCDQLGGGAYDPKIDPANFVAEIDNPLLPLHAGTTLHYQTQTAAGLETDDVEVTPDTRVILGVTCTVVHDAVKLDGDLTEDTIDWYVQDSAGNVWYFGEEAKQYADGLLVGIDGSWMAGVDGALPGIVMEAHPAVGDVYRQEFAIGEAEDMGQVVALGQSVDVPYGSFANALETKEFSGLEPGADENKYYVPGVGNVLTVDLTTGERQELLSITP